MLPLDTTRELLARYTADLPADLLQEVLDYVQFLRLKRLSHSPTDVLRTELRVSQQHEWQHLEDEFADFELRFPPHGPAIDTDNPLPGGAQIDLG